MDNFPEKIIEKGKENMFLYLAKSGLIPVQLVSDKLKVTNKQVMELAANTEIIGVYSLKSESSVCMQDAERYFRHLGEVQAVAELVADEFLFVREASEMVGEMVEYIKVKVLEYCRGSMED